MKSKDLIKGKCYKVDKNYIMFEKIEDDKIYTFNYCLEIKNNIITYKTLDTTLSFVGNYFCTLLWFDYFTMFKCEEIEKSLFISLLPLGHPERIKFRNNRIKNILNGI